MIRATPTAGPQQNQRQQQHQQQHQQQQAQLRSEQGQLQCRMNQNGTASFGIATSAMSRGRTYAHERRPRWSLFHLFCPCLLLSLPSLKCSKRISQHPAGNYCFGLITSSLRSRRVSSVALASLLHAPFLLAAQSSAVLFFFCPA